MLATRRLVLPCLFALVAAAGCGSPGSDAPVDVPVSTDAADASGDAPIGGDVCGAGCTLGEKSCGASGPRLCIDPDGDGCTEWSGEASCETGAVCQDGECVPGCPTQECTSAGAKRCAPEGEAVQVCGDSDADGCLEWSEDAGCEAGLVCSQGFCQVSCSDECSVSGARKCDGNAVVTCGDADADGCLEWGAASDCGEMTCSGGFCASECSDDCTAVGARKCDGDGVTTCGDHDADGCLEWGTIVACDEGQSCSGGFCKEECTSECTVTGAKKCDLNKVVSCGDWDGDPCLEWGSPTPCAEGLVCSSGACGSECSEECTVVGAKQCDPSGGLATCGDFDADDCLEWGTSVSCDEGLVCSQGNCSLDCSDACGVVGGKQCVAGATGQYQVCDDHDADGCLEWGSAQSCAAGLACDGGACVSGCSDGCSVAGAKVCDGGGVATCGDYNDDGCLEWGTVDFCAEGQTCQGGFCTESCSNVCTVSGARKCDGDAVVTCGDHDDDGCLDWGAPETCAAGLVCAAGHCSTQCADECTVVGAEQCDASGGVIACGDWDADACLEWGDPVPCEAPAVCSQGDCAQTCSDECDVSGGKQCVPGSTDQRQVCDDWDQDGCLEWGSPESCEAGLVCAAGSCASECADACNTAGARTCQGGGVATCGDYNADGCLEWGTVVYCQEGETCQDGFCTETCVSTCTVVGAKKCDANSVVTCDDHDQDGCLEWGGAAACGAGLVCAGGHCASQCTDDCTAVGAKQCDEAGGIITCGDFDGDDCLEWGTPVLCDSPYVCSQGKCSLTCTDECAVDHQKQCVPGAETQYQVCGEHDGDGCLEWGSSESCAEGLICSGGNCASTCEDTCTVSGESVCDAGGVVTCDDWNADGCLEWGTPVYCEAWEACEAGSCVTVAPPAQVVISEIMYDGDGSDADCFVELRGPAGTDLTGFSLVGVNGNGGSEYNTIALGGTLGVDGLFVVAQTSAAAWVADEADVLHGNADYQNGPDSVQLRFGDQVVDALGYGSFDASDVFAGEGSAAPDASPGTSLARDAAGTDTDDNAADFTLRELPTPGASNEVADAAPSAAIACLAGGETGQTLTFDASGSTDDGSIAGYAFDFGDGQAAQGTSPTATHAYATADTYAVSVTVTDDGGQQDAAVCQVVVTAPVSTGEAPTASFVASSTGSTSVTLDASASSDVETASADLEVRWDFQNDGTWDTAWSTTKVTAHDYGDGNTYTVKLQVRDADGQTDTETKAVTPASATYVSGPVGTTTWSGVVVVTNDVTVQAGETLTVAAGTQVLVMYVDDGGAGSVGIRVEGALDVQGTAAEPVVFTVYQASSKAPKAWEGIEVRATGSTVTHAVVEYATTGIVLYEVDSFSLTDSTVRFCQYGMEASWKGASNLTGVTLADNVEYGLTVYGSYKGDTTVSLVNSTIRDNGGSGLWLRDESSTSLLASTVSGNGSHGLEMLNATVGMTNSSVVDNGGDGLYVRGKGPGQGWANLTIQTSLVEGNAMGFWLGGDVRGSVTLSEVTANRKEAFRFETHLEYSKWFSPTVVVNDSDVHGNSTAEGGVMVAGPTLHLEGTPDGQVGHGSDVISTPNGSPVQGVFVQFLPDTWNGTVEKATLRRETEDGELFIQWQQAIDPAKFHDLAEEDASSVHASLTLGSTFSGEASLNIEEVLYYAAGASTEVVDVTNFGTIDMTGNWWGTADPAGGLVAGRADAIDASSPASGPVTGAGLP